MENRWIDLEEAAAALGISTQRMLGLVLTNKIKGRIRVHAEDVLAYKAAEEATRNATVRALACEEE